MLAAGGSQLSPSVVVAFSQWSCCPKVTPFLRFPRQLTSGDWLMTGPKAWTSCLNLVQLWGALSGLEFPVRLTDTSQGHQLHSAQAPCVSVLQVLLPRELPLHRDSHLRPCFLGNLISDRAMFWRLFLISHVGEFLCLEVDPLGWRGYALSALSDILTRSWKWLCTFALPSVASFASLVTLTLLSLYHNFHRSLYLYRYLSWIGCR